MTNFEGIAPEALAKSINDAVNLAIYNEQCFISNPCYNTNCEECIIKWLKQEAEEKNDKL